MKPASAEGDITRVRRGGFATACGAADGIQLALRAGAVSRHGGDVGGDHAHAEHRVVNLFLEQFSRSCPPVHAAVSTAGFHTGEDVVMPAVT